MSVIPSTVPARPCATCGHCPTCGHAPIRVYPTWPRYPIYSSPSWGGGNSQPASYPTVTC